MTPPTIPGVKDLYTIFLTVITDSASTFVVGLSNIEGETELHAMQAAINAALTKGVMVCVVAGTPPVPIKPVAAVPFHAIKTNKVAIVGG